MPSPVTMHATWLLCAITTRHPALHEPLYGDAAARRLIAQSQLIAANLLAPDGTPTATGIDYATRCMIEASITRSN